MYTEAWAKKEAMTQFKAESLAQLSGQPIDTIASTASYDQMNFRSQKIQARKSQALVVHFQSSDERAIWTEELAKLVEEERNKHEARKIRQR